MKNLLYAGVVGPLLFIAVFLVEGATRPGYSVWRNYVSQLATGDGGWVQVLNFVVCGGLVLAFAGGLRRSIKGTRGSIGAPVLLALFALALFVAATFPTDPALGYPPGAPAVHSPQGIVHGLAGLAAFTLLTAASLVMAWHFAADAGSTRWAVYSAAAGLATIAFFVASGVAAVLDNAGRWPDAPAGLFQRIAILAGFTWISILAWHQLREPQARTQPLP